MLCDGGGMTPTRGQTELPSAHGGDQAPKGSPCYFQNCTSRRLKNLCVGQIQEPGQPQGSYPPLPLAQEERSVPGMGDQRAGGQGRAGALGLTWHVGL